MLSTKNDLIIASSIAAIGLVLIIIASVLLYNSYSQYNTCYNNASPLCPNIACAGINTSTLGAGCQQYAYRLDANGNVQCNFPMPSLTPISSSS